MSLTPIPIIFRVSTCRKITEWLDGRGAANQRQELIAGCFAAAEGAEHGAGDGAGVLLLDPAHHHAEVPGLADYTHTGGLDDLLDTVRDFFRHPFLNLQAPREDIHDARNLAQPDD